MKKVDKLKDCSPKKCIKCGKSTKNCELVNGLCAQCRG